MSTQYAVLAYGTGHNINTRCVLCGDWFECPTGAAVLVDISAFDERKLEKARADLKQGSLSLSEALGESNNGDVCEECVAAGAVGTSQRMLQYASQLEAHAASLREEASHVATTPAERWVTPQDLKNAEHEFNQALAAALQ